MPALVRDLLVAGLLPGHRVRRDGHVRRSVDRHAIADERERVLRELVGRAAEHRDRLPRATGVGDRHVERAPDLARGEARFNLERRELVLRCAMNVVSLDPTRVRGTRGRLPDRVADGPVLLRSDSNVPDRVDRTGRIDAANVRDPLLQLRRLSAPVEGINR
ncbi:hypothetical protein LZG04_27675 [Saccharothrix sp. S26]|uniref:hypothetical protein n=1 Tax=Saccharothrix sp. S26 TaxID=2907215 RepID=UPI001F218E75|nr:hypothetical protein [Saccharothrix sp. S26]MCE6998550.1 hypothetical protein [Saccharothrix sp. S26]